MRHVAFLIATASLWAQMPHVMPDEKPPVLIDGMGSYTFTIATKSPEAQKFFNQGLNMLYGFNRYEALRSFHKASELDSRALMPHVGMAWAQGPHINMDLDGDVDMKAYCAELDQTKPLRAQAPAHEQAWFDATAARCPDAKDLPYQAALQKLISAYPDDMDARTFYAESLMIPIRWHWYDAKGQPAPGTEEAIRMLESVLLRNTTHPGANHFYIHAVESSPTPERGIPSAQRLMGIVPAAGHIVHMPGHIWMALGEFQYVIDTNERAVQVDRDYFQKTGLFGHHYTGYFIHNLHFVAVARQMQGNWSQAILAASAVVQEATPLADEAGPIVDAFMPMPLFAMLRFARWDDILATPAPSPKLQATAAIWHFARATAYHAKNRAADAAQEQQAFEAARTSLPKDWPWLNNTASDILDVAHEILLARLSPTEQAAIPHWRRAVELQDQFIYDEPPPLFYPVRESLGAALLRAGQAREAEAMFREALEKSPKNGRVLFGLMESLKAQGKADQMELVRPEFNAAWRYADVILKIEDY